MIKKASLALAGLMALSSAAFASDAWNQGIGYVSDFTTDETSFTTLPQVVASHSNSIFAEGLGGGADNGGINANLLGGTLGVWFNRQTNDFSYMYDLIGDNDYYGPDNPEKRIDLIYALPLGEKYVVALGVNRASYYVKESESNPVGYWDNYEKSVNNMGLNLGLDIKELAFLKLLQIGLQVQTESQLYKVPDISSWPGGEEQKSDFLGLNLRVGADLEGSNGHFNRFELGLKSRSGTEKSFYYQNNDKISALNYNLGYAAGISGEKGLLMAGLMLYGSQKKVDYTAENQGYWQESEYNLVFSVGAESKVTPWLTLRFGSGAVTLSNYNYFESADYYGGGDYTYVDGNWSWGPWTAAGASIKLGDITIDGVLDTSGYLANTFGQISMSYSWQ